MDFLPPVVAKLIADTTEFTAAMGAADAKLTGFEAAQKKLAGAGKVAFLALGAAAVAVGAESVNLAQKFDQAMELIHTQAGAAQSEVDGLKDKVLALAPATGIGPEKLAEGLYHIESTGFRGKQALDILTAAAKLSAMGLADLDTVTFALSGTMSVGMKDIKDAADATAYLNAIVGMGDMKMDKLAAAIGTGVLPSFKSAGLGMTDFGAALATISDNSVGADEAATRLRMTVSLMAAPSLKARDALASIGIGATQLADDMRKPDGLLVAVMDLKTHLEESGKTASEQNAIISNAFGGGRTSSAILTLLEESDRLKSKYGQLGTAASRAAQADEAWKQQQKQFGQQMKELGAEVQVIGVKIGNFLIPYIQKSAEWLTKHIAVVKIAAVVIGSLLVAAMMAFTYSVIANTVAMLANPVTWIVLGIVAAIALLAVGIYELVKHWGAVWGWIHKYSLIVWHALVTAWNATWAAVAGVVMWIWTNIIKPVVDFFWLGLIKPIMTYFEIWWKFLEFGFTIVGDLLGTLYRMFMVAFNFIADIIMWWWHNVTEPMIMWLWHNAIEPTITLLEALGHAWERAIGWAVSAILWFWHNVTEPMFSWLMHNAIQPTWDLIVAFGVGWGKVWDAAGSALKWVYDHTLKPTFDLIMKGVHMIEDAWNSIMNSPSSAGNSVAKFLGFDKGGWVPGPAGAPKLAVVHGGEFVLSRDMIAAGQGGPVPPATATSGSGHPGGAGAGPSSLVAHLYIDGKKFHTAYIPVVQQYKDRTGATGLT